MHQDKVEALHSCLRTIQSLLHHLESKSGGLLSHVVLKYQVNAQLPAAEECLHDPDLLRQLHLSLKGHLDRLISASTTSCPDDVKSRSCKVCRKRFADAELLRHHQESVHPHRGKKQHSGPVVAAEAETGMPDTEQLPFFCCQMCYHSFRATVELAEHGCEPSLFIGSPALLHKHHRFVCSYCHEEFRKCSRMLHHIRLCTGGPFVCRICSEQFDTMKLMRQHNTQQHPGQKSFACQFCASSFSRNTSLQKHLIRHHERPQSSFQCDKCPKAFLKKVYLTHHKTRFHHLEKPLLCHICAEDFVTEASLKAHLLLHDPVKRFSCSQCGKAFGRKDKLQCHLATHTGVRPYACGLCPKRFVTKCKLDEHVRRHNGEKRFSCLVCNKTFSGSHDLRKHLKKIHPNISKKIKPFVPLTPQILENIHFQ